ncbi:MAG: hypothetical protein IT556_19175 [Acetobacteraceae bacterium]|nr:hypothetical protein [Acetobacteraceae bacterium]
MPEILLLTTSTGQPARLSDLERLIGSLVVSASRLGERNAGWRVRHVLLLQNGAGWAGPLPDWCEVISHPGPLSLSAARNRLFAHVGTALAKASVVGFPDDDAWYTPDWLSCLAGIYARDNPPLLLTRYASAPAADPAAAPLRPLTPGMITYWAASPSMFVAGQAAARAARFDERLSVGPGAIWNGGEDTDFCLRVWSAHGAGRGGGVLVDAPAIGHRDRTPGMSLNYIVGNTFVLARHAKRHPSLWPKLFKKWAIFAVSVLRGKIPRARWKPFFQAQAAAFAGVEVR